LVRRITGSQPACLIAGILLLTKARTFGQPVKIEIVCTMDRILLNGPLMFRNLLLTECGIPHVNNIVIIGGDSEVPMEVYTQDIGSLSLSRSINQAHQVTKIIMQMLQRDKFYRLPVLAMLEYFGLVAEPFIFDLLFNTNMSAFNAFGFARIVSFELVGKGLTNPFTVFNHIDDEKVGWDAVTGRLEVSKQKLVRDCLISIKQELSNTDWDILHKALEPFLELFSIMPSETMFPSFSSELLEISKAIPMGLGNCEDTDILFELQKKFRWLGGRFQDLKLPAYNLGDDDNMQKDWTWFFDQVKLGETGAEKLWRQIMDFTQ
jgi:hypothetical protein